MDLLLYSKRESFAYFSAFSIIQEVAPLLRPALYLAEITSMMTAPVKKVVAEKTKRGHLLMSSLSESLMKSNLKTMTNETKVGSVQEIPTRMMRQIMIIKTVEIGSTRIKKTKTIRKRARVGWTS